METQNKTKIKVQDIEELYEILPEELRGDFAIGMHGFSDRNFNIENESGKYELDANKIEQTKKDILSQGLKFNKDRKLLSTVMFSENGVADYIQNEGYTDGIIIALPKILRGESGREIFVGSPNEERMFEGNWWEKKSWDRNREPTSLSEIILPGEGLLDSMFIIGTYTKTEHGIEVNINQDHIAFKGGKVPDDFFEEKADKLMGMIKGLELDESIVKETITQQEKYSGKMNLSINFQQELSAYIQTKLRQPEEATQKKEQLRLAIQEAKQQGMDGETIKRYIYPYQAAGKINMEEWLKWSEISEKYGIHDIMAEDYMSKEYSGYSAEMIDLIDDLTQQEIEPSNHENDVQIQIEQSQGDYSVSLVELGKKSYQHFGRKIAEKLKETFNMLKSKFFSKDMDKDNSKNTYTTR